jgi:hypothetical protein
MPPFGLRIPKIYRGRPYWSPFFTQAGLLSIIMRQNGKCRDEMECLCTFLANYGGNTG